MAAALNLSKYSNLIVLATCLCILPTNADSTSNHWRATSYPDTRSVKIINEDCGGVGTFRLRDVETNKCSSSPCRYDNAILFDQIVVWFVPAMTSTSPTVAVKTNFSNGETLQNSSTLTDGLYAFVLNEVRISNLKGNLSLSGMRLEIKNDDGVDEVCVSIRIRFPYENKNEKSGRENLFASALVLTISAAMGFAYFLSTV